MTSVTGLPSVSVVRFTIGRNVMNTQVWLVLIDREMRKRVVALTALLFQLLSFAAFASAQAESTQTTAASTPDKLQLLQRVPPTYPPLARQARIQGGVVLDVVIGTDGSVNSATVVSGHPLLIQSAIDAVKLWKYKPYVHDGRTVEVRTQITVQFALQDHPTDSTQADLSRLPDSAKLPACPTGAALTSSQDSSNHKWYSCKVAEKSADGMEMCHEWDDDHWSRAALVPCGSSVAATTEATYAAILKELADQNVPPCPLNTEPLDIMRDTKGRLYRNCADIGGRTVRDSQTRSAPSKPKATDPTSETPSCLKFSQLSPNNNDLKRSDYARSLQAKWDAMRREAVRQGDKGADNVLFSFVAFGDESEFLTISTNPKNEKALNFWQTLFADGTNLDGEACFYGFNEVRFDLGVGKESRRVATHLESVKRMLKNVKKEGKP